ncbi:MAG: DUF3089 domain-containing protein [Saprospiraceae bacterium]|nr:DUF3089 domain-containing protein [Saprospiraceae bacterium]
MYQNILVALSLLLFTSCASKIPRKSFVAVESLAPDYSQPALWAAHPSKKDLADDRPEGNSVHGEDRKADVFFLHPTSYLDERGNDQWNASLDDPKTNKVTDDGAIHFQASAFNSAGQVYAPRYRQAHLHAYFTNDTSSAKAAFELAYRDVKAAFMYYLSHYNEGRPFIIASHSQGTTHAIRLIKELIDGKELQKQLIAAYLLGMPVHKDDFLFIPPCDEADQTNCFTGWRTFKKGYEPTWKEREVVVTNPLSWTRNAEYMSATSNPGTILRDFNDIYVNLVDAQISGNILWATKPKFPGSIFLTTKNYHVADVNFYYFSIRDNALKRVDQYLKAH